MLRCLAGICGSSQESAELPRQSAVKKPILRLDETRHRAEAKSISELAKLNSYVLAPPGSEHPVAIVTQNFQQVVSRLLIVVPSAGFPASCWDASIGRNLQSIDPILGWAEANGYAVVVFSGEDFQSKPVEAWESILRGSPARSAAVIVASGMLETVIAALTPVHPLLYSRFRTICIRGADLEKALPSNIPDELQRHLESSQAEIPKHWEDLETQAFCQCLFQFLQEREERWSNVEALKYAGFQDLKENDMPGIKRLGVDDRIKKLQRDRNNDELARLLAKHEKASTNGGLQLDEDVPGLD